MRKPARKLDLDALRRAKRIVVRHDDTAVSEAEKHEAAWSEELWDRVERAYEEATGGPYAEDDPTAAAFMLGAATMLDALGGDGPDTLSWELAVGRRKLQTNRSSASAGGKNRGDDGLAGMVREEARQYRRSTPYDSSERDTSTRRMAAILADRLGMKFGTVREHLRKLGIK